MYIKIIDMKYAYIIMSNNDIIVNVLKSHGSLCVFVFVCVSERERERERGIEANFGILF